MFYTEPTQMKAMHATMPVKQSVPAMMFEQTAGDLSKKPVHTEDCRFVDCPVCQIAFCRIVCVAVSSFWPKSVKDPKSKSGSSFLKLVAYLRTLTFQDRPNVVLIMECVSRLDHHRKLAKQREENWTNAVIVAQQQELAWNAFSANVFIIAFVLAVCGLKTSCCVNTFVNWEVAYSPDIKAGLQIAPKARVKELLCAGSKSSSASRVHRK